MEYNFESIKKAVSEIQVFGNETLIPIDEEAFIAGFALILDEDMQPAIDFFNHLANAVPNNCTFGFIDRNITPLDIESLVNDTSEANLAIFAFFSDTATNYIIQDNLAQAIQKISKDKKTIFIFFNFVQIENYINFRVDLTLQVSNNSEPSLIAAALKLAGKGFFESIINNNIQI